MLVSNELRCSDGSSFTMRDVLDQLDIYTNTNTSTPYGRTSMVWDSLLVRKSGCTGGRGFAPRPGQ